jgi:transcription elongation factor Elf1
MIDKQHGKFILICDNCNDAFEFGKGEDFEDVRNYIKSEGWQTVKVGEDWLHYCDECRREA